MHSFNVILFVTAISWLVPTLASEGVANAQKEVAVVQHKADLNGDGKMDELRIDDLGTISVLITGDEDAGAWTPLAAQGKIIGGSFTVHPTLDPSGKPVILAIAKLRRSKTQTYEEALVLSYSPGKLQALWRGPQGNDQADGALRLFIELGDQGLVRFASRNGVFRCDGKPAHLDATRYSFASKSFVPIRQAVRIDPSSTRLQAQPDPPSGISDNTRGFWFRPRGASSSLRAAKSSDLVAPLAIADNNNKTAWVENMPGVGRGEFVTLQSGLGPVHVQALRFELGHGGAAKGFRSPAHIGLLVGKEKTYWIDFPKANAGQTQWVKLPTTVLASCVSLVIADSDVTKAGRQTRRQSARTAISEVSILSTEELDPARASRLIADRIAKGRAKADTRRLLRNMGEGATDALLLALRETDNRRAKTRLRLALATIPAAPEALTQALLNDSLRSKQYIVLTRALHKLGKASVPALSAALVRDTSGREGSKRIALTLQTMPGQEPEAALLAAIAQGGNGKRKAVWRALGERPGIVPVLQKAITKAQEVPKLADLYLSLAIASKSYEPESEQRRGVGRALMEALAKPNLPYELHYRLLQSAGGVGGTEVSRVLHAQYQNLSQDTDVEKQALSEVAAIAIVQSEQNSESSVFLLSSKSPGVRLAVLHSMGPDKIDIGAVGQRLESDRWPEIRRSAAALLGGNCEGENRFPPLLNAARSDSDSVVAKTALSGLQNCKRPSLFSVLLHLTDSDSRPLSLRLYAARQLASTENPDRRAILKRFRDARQRALSDKVSAQIAAALTVSLGDLGTPKAIGMLEKTAVDPAFPQLQAAALHALSQICPRSSRSIFRKLQNSYEHSVARSATMAYRQCR